MDPSVGKPEHSKHMLVSPIINAEFNYSVETASQATGKQVRQTEGIRQASLHLEELDKADYTGPRPSSLLRMADNNVEHTTENHDTEPTVSSVKIDFEIPAPHPEPANGEPVDDVSRIHSESHDEKVTRTQDGKVKVMKSSVSESKEYVHRVQKSFSRNSPDTSVSEFTDLPKARIFTTEQRKPTNTEGEPSTAPTPVTVIRTHELHTPETPKVYRSSPVERPTLTLRSTIPLNPSQMVPIEQHEAMKRQLEAEIAYLKSMSLPAQQHGEEQTSRELLHRRIIMLESDLRDSKNVSELVSEELQNLRKQYEFLINRSLQLENSNRALHDKVREYKSANKKMLRDLNDRDILVEKLHESHSREKKAQRHLVELQEEQGRLARDYEILRQSYQRKEQQLGGLFNERADLYRKLDESEYDKLMLERQLQAKTRVKRSSPRRAFYSCTQIFSSTNQRTKSHSVDRTLPPSGQTIFSGNELSNQRLNASPEKHEKSEPADNQEEIKENPVVNNCENADGEDGHTEPKTGDETLPLDPQLSADDQTVKGTLPGDSVGPGQKSPKMAEKVNHHPVQYGFPTSGSGSPSRIPRLDRRSGTDSAEDEIYTYTATPMTTFTRTLEDSRYRNYRTSSLGKRYLGKASDLYVPRSPVRYVRRVRPSSAYGFTHPMPVTGDYEVYRNPLPRRSTTSLGTLHMPEVYPRGLDREYSRIERPAVPRYPMYYTDTPDPFKYETVRHSRAEMIQLEDDLMRLQREKRSLEKQYYSHGSIRQPKYYRRADEQFHRLVQVNNEIRNLQMRLDSARAMRRANPLK